MPAPKWLTDLPKPAFMAIGDSLLNGMLSTSINDTMAGTSIPAYVGQSLQPVPGFAPFRRSAYPAPVLVDVEATAKRFANSIVPPVALLEVLAHLSTIKADIAANARDWLARFAAAPGSGPAQFDNLAIAGAIIPDAFNTTQAQLEARIALMAPVIRAEPDPLKWAGQFPANDAEGPRAWGVGDVHITFNARHLRNPDNRAGLDDLAIIDVVGARQPKVLLVDMGANHGLVTLVNGSDSAGGTARLQKFVADWPACARELARLPGVAAVIMMLLPLPSQVPCLSPPNPDQDPDPEPAPQRADHYFDRYVSAIDPVSSGFGHSGDEVREFDRLVGSINDQVRASMTTAFQGSGKHLAFVGLGDLLGQHDYKHRRGPKLKGTSGREYSNYPLGQELFSRLRGGICGLDEIHPTTIGYRFVAEAIRTAIANMPIGVASNQIEITDVGDPFLEQPHWPTIALLNALYPHAAAGTQFAGAAMLAPGGRAEGDKLLFRPAWMR